MRLTCNGAHAIISLKKENEIDAKQALYFILASNEIVKNAIIVDDDIGIYNPREVDWALSYRFQADKDLIALSGLKGSPIDPSAQLGGYASITLRMALDATAPIVDRRCFEKINIPKKAKKWHGK